MKAGREEKEKKAATRVNLVATRQILGPEVWEIGREGEESRGSSENRLRGGHGRKGKREKRLLSEVAKKFLGMGFREG